MGRGERPYRLDGIFSGSRTDHGSIARPRCRQPPRLRRAYLWLHGRRRAAQRRPADIYRRDASRQVGPVRSQRHDLSTLERRASAGRTARIRTGPAWIRDATDRIAGRSVARSFRAMATRARFDLNAALTRMIEFD